MPHIPRIAIIGAGPAGCTLARLLVRASIPVTVFEGEATPSVRGQGGTLDLHTDTGLKALEEAGLKDEYEKYARYDGEAYNLVDKNMKSFVKVGGATKASSRGRPEIDRESLRDILLNSLPEGTIRWNCKLRSVDEEDLSLHLDATTEQGFDLVVGADGAWSKVRPVLTNTEPFYAGVGGYDMYIDDVENRYPDLYKLCNRGSIFAFSDRKHISAAQKGDGSLIVYATTARDEDWMETCGYDVKDPVEVKKALAKEFEDWKQPLVKFTQVANHKDITPRNLYMLPVGHRWDHRKGATLIGDAAHLMTIHAGEGVNTAMDDALKLSNAIIQGSKAENPVEALNEEVKAFEEEMFVRATEVVDHSIYNTKLMFFTPGAPDSTVAPYMRRLISNHWLVKLLFPLWVVRLLLRIMFRW